MTSLQSAEHDVPARDAPRAALPERPSADFEAIYREHFRFVWRSVRRLGVDGSFVDDVVQETFLVVHRRLADFEARSSLKTWLYGIVRRVVADHRRTLFRKPGVGGDAYASDFDSMRDETTRGPEASMQQTEQVRLLRILLAGLDDEKREVFILTEFEGMTMAEIAEALDVNPNTVSSRLRAARREFEDALEQATKEDSAQAPDMDGRRRQ